MATKKKQTKKPCKCGGKCSGKCCGNCYGTLWIGGSNISEESREWVTYLIKQGATVYWLEGRPPGGGCVPGSTGCQ